MDTNLRLLIATPADVRYVSMSGVPVALGRSDVARQPVRSARTPGRAAVSVGRQVDILARAELRSIASFEVPGDSAITAISVRQEEDMLLTVEDQRCASVRRLSAVERGHTETLRMVDDVRVTCGVLARDGWMVLGGLDGSVQVWDRVRNDSPVAEVNFGSPIASISSLEQGVVVVHVHNKPHPLVVTLTGSWTPLKSSSPTFAVVSCGTQVITVGGHARIWSAPSVGGSWQVKREWPTEAGCGMLCADVDDSGQFLALAGPRYVDVFSVESGDQVSRFEAPKSVTLLRFV